MAVGTRIHEAKEIQTTPTMVQPDFSNDAARLLVVSGGRRPRLCRPRCRQCSTPPVAVPPRLVHPIISVVLRFAAFLLVVKAYRLLRNLYGVVEEK